MQLSSAENTAEYQIRSYKPGSFQVNEEIYHSSLIISANNLIADSLPESFQELTPSLCQKIIALKPNILLLGTGVSQHFLPIDLQQLFLNANIGVETMSTSAACRTFQVLSSEGRNVVAALFIR